jgi:hypothetical protein
MTRTHKSNITPIPLKPTVMSVHNERPTLGQTVKEGFGLGLGVSVAQHAVNGVMNFLMPQQPKPVDNSRLLEYEQCMKYSVNDYETCKALLSKSL